MFFSGGKSCPRSRRISNRIGSRKCCSKTRNGKCSKQQWFYSNTAFLLRKIHFRTIHLIYSHSITNKIEYIFCLLSKARLNKNSKMQIHLNRFIY